MAAPVGASSADIFATDAAESVGVLATDAVECSLRATEAESLLSALRTSESETGALLMEQHEALQTSAKEAVRQFQKDYGEQRKGITWRHGGKDSRFKSVQEVHQELVNRWFAHARAAVSQASSIGAEGADMDNSEEAAMLRWLRGRTSEKAVLLVRQHGSWHGKRDEVQKVAASLGVPVRTGKARSAQSESWMTCVRIASKLG